LPADHKWPSHVNFSRLVRRVEALHSTLLQIWRNPVNNYFYKAVMSQVNRVGADKVFNRLGDFKGSEIASVG
jgi:hypothetical protein